MLALDGPPVTFTRNELAVPLLYEDLVSIENEVVRPFVTRLLPDVYRGQGSLWQREVAGYLQSIHARYLATHRRGTLRSTSILELLEEGIASRIILQDLVALDNTLSLQGTLVALYVWEDE